jgi:hypothetical protein
LPRLSYANVIATLALFLALGGISWAAFNLPNNSVGTRNLKRNAVTSPKVKNHSLRKVDFRDGQLPAGARGPTGPSGPAGTASAYAKIHSDGTVNADHSKGITQSMVTHPDDGVYCFDVSALPGAPFKSAVATAEPSGTSPTTSSDRFVTTQVSAGDPAGCAAGTDVFAVVWDASGNAPVNWYFTIWLEN